MESKKKRLKLQVLISVLMVTLLLGMIGISFAWLAFWNRLNTISVLQIPSKISITGANRSEMQRISLEMTSDDTQVGDRVTIRRVFCIESTDNFLLEVAHTTNIDNMDIKIFPVSNENSEPDKESGSVQGADAEAGRVFYYDPDDEKIAGSYLNREVVEENEKEIQIAIQGGNQGSLHGQTYAPQVDDNKVQRNAEPLYWLTASVEDCKRTGYSRTGTAADGQTEIYYRYYVLELSWDVTQSETDIVYLLASHPE